MKSDQIFEMIHSTPEAEVGVGLKFDISTKGGHVLRIGPRSLDEVIPAKGKVIMIITKWYEDNGDTSVFATYVNKLGQRTYVPVWIIEPPKVPSGVVSS